MEKRRFGNTGIDVTVLGFGGAEIGYEGASQDVVDRLLGGALDAGLNVIDTAECYIDSEEKIGRAVSHRRGDFFLLTKCGHAAGLEGADWDPDMLERSIDRSLRLLRTDRVDLLQLHSCMENVLRSGGVIEVLQRAREKGKTRFIGYSGDGAAALYAIECGFFDALQTSVNIADQEAIDLTLPLARQRGLGVIAKRPIANAVWKHSTKPANSYVHTYWERLQELRFDFLSGDSGAMADVALRFTLSVPGVHTALAGTTKPDRWRQNASLTEHGPLDGSRYEAIRQRWRETATPVWVGQN